MPNYTADSPGVVGAHSGTNTTSSVASAPAVPVAGGNGNAGAAKPVQAQTPGVLMPDPFAQNVRLLSTVTLSSDTHINVSGLRYEVTRLAVSGDDHPRPTSISTQYPHQAIIVALDANGFTQESMNLVYQKQVFIPRWLPVASVWVLCKAGSQWKVEVYG
jgi:hypothetical protein